MGPLGRGVGDLLFDQSRKFYYIEGGKGIEGGDKGTENMRHFTARIQNGIVTVTAPSLHAHFHGIWLRDHCPASRHPATGQRALETHLLPLDLAPRSAAWEEAEPPAASPEPSLVLEWPPQSPGAPPHVSRFPASWLRKHAYWEAPPPHTPDAPATAPAAADPLAIWGADPARDAAGRTLWRGASFGPPSSPHALRPFPRVAHGDYMARSGEGLLYALRALRDWGFVLVEGTPATEAATRSVCKRIGFLRPTLYGAGMWRTEVKPIGGAGGGTDTAYTALPLPLHTDGNYLGEAPGLQVFHCTTADASGGGDSLLMDGLSLAAQLRACHPSAFDLLTVWPLHYHHTGRDAVVGAARPVFELDEGGGVAGVHFNNDDRGPVVRMPRWGGAVARAEALMGRDDRGAGLAVAKALQNPETAMPLLYAALKALGEALRDPGLTVRLPLRPGSVLVFDNTRVLHGRDGFQASSGRTLVGCYIGADEWRSKLRLLEMKAGKDEK